MYFVEAAFVLALLGFLVAHNVRAASRGVLLALFAAGSALIVLTLLLGQGRWQMAPAYLLFLILTLLLLKRRHSRAVVRGIGVLAGGSLLAFSVALSLGLPHVHLPPPAGPHAVGTTSFTLVDETRDDTVFGAPERSRELYVRAWYPGAPDASSQAPRARTLWQELYTGEQDLLAFAVGYMADIETHSFEGVPLSSAAPSFPLIVFTHGMLSVAEQNTLLMEHLASHGFIVVSVGHTYMSARVNLSGDRAVYADFDAFAAAGSDRVGPTSEEVSERAARTEDPDERVALWIEYFENSTGFNSLMSIWVDDLRFVLESVLAPAATGTGSELDRLRDRIDRDRVGVLGMSFGGGAVAELCKADARCRAGMNLDGGAYYGKRQRQPMRMPYLTLVSPDNEVAGLMMGRSTSTFYAIEVEGAAHGDFMDVTLTAPIAKWLGINGSIPGERMVELVNAVALSFFDAYLRGGSELDLSPETYPELSVSRN